MKKSLCIAIFAATLLLVFCKCSKKQPNKETTSELSNTSADVTQPQNPEFIPESASPVEEPKPGIIACVMVNGKLYYDTGRNSTVKYRCGLMDGNIDSSTEDNRLPEKNNQSNFGTGFGYQYGASEGLIEINTGDEWRIFATEEVMEEFLSNHTDLSFNDNTLNVLQNTVCEIGKGTMKAAVDISDEDASGLWEILTVRTWDESGTTDCLSNISLNLGGHLYQYHSDCGTFNKYDLGRISYYSSRLPDDPGKSLKLSEEERIMVNGILEKYVSLSTDVTNAFN